MLCHVHLVAGHPLNLPLFFAPSLKPWHARLAQTGVSSRVRTPSTSQWPTLATLTSMSGSAIRRSLRAKSGRPTLTSRHGDSSRKFAYMWPGSTRCLGDSPLPPFSFRAWDIHANSYCTHNECTSTSSRQTSSFVFVVVAASPPLYPFYCMPLMHPEPNSPLHPLLASMAPRRVSTLVHDLRKCLP